MRSKRSVEGQAGFQQANKGEGSLDGGRERTEGMEWPPLNVSGHREEEILVEAESLGSDLRQNWRESEGLNPCWTLSWRSRAFPEGNLSKKGHKASKRWEFGDNQSRLLIIRTSRAKRMGA